MRIGLIVLCCLLLSPFAAVAATKCLPEGAVHCSYSSEFANKYDWKVSCNIAGEAVEWRGISACSSSTGVVDQTADSLSMEDGLTCWCKLTAPFETKWRLYYAYGSSTELSHCLANCSNNCASNTAIYG